MTENKGIITLDADEYRKLLDELIDLQKRLRSVGLAGFNSEKPTPCPKPSMRDPSDESEAMVLDIDISGIEWKLSNRDGGGPAEPNAGWCWAFSTTRDGGIRREAAQLVSALEQYGRVRVGQHEITLGGRDKLLLNRKKLTHGSR